MSYSKKIPRNKREQNEEPVRYLSTKILSEFLAEADNPCKMEMLLKVVDSIRKKEYEQMMAEAIMEMILE